MTMKVANTFPRRVQSPQRCHSLQTFPSGVRVSLQTSQASSRQPPGSDDSSPAEVSPAGYLSTIITSPAAAVSRLETWSDSASEETCISYSPVRDFDGLQILLTRSPSNYQMPSNRIYAQGPQ